MENVFVQDDIKSIEDFDETDIVTVNEDEIALDILADTDTYDKYSVIPKSELRYPYLVFKSKYPESVLKAIASGLLNITNSYTIDDMTDEEQFSDKPKMPEVKMCNLYMQDEETGKYLHVKEIPIDPLVVAILERIAMKDSVYFCAKPEQPERLAKPEQFVRQIKIRLDTKSNQLYWEKLKESEKSQADMPTDINKLVGSLYD